MRIPKQSILSVGLSVCMAALGLRLDVESERRFVRRVKDGQLNGLCVYEALDRFGLLYETTTKKHFLVLRRNRCLYLLWRMLGRDEYIAVFAEARGDMIKGVFCVVSFPSMAPLYPKY